MRISDWSSDVCSSDLGLRAPHRPHRAAGRRGRCDQLRLRALCAEPAGHRVVHRTEDPGRADHLGPADRAARSEEHTSELQSLMRISYAVLCLKKNIKTK